MLLNGEIEYNFVTKFTQSLLSGTNVIAASGALVKHKYGPEVLPLVSVKFVTTTLYVVSASAANFTRCLLINMLIKFLSA